MPRQPDVTVVVIAYNDAKRVSRAVRSVLEQSWAPVEAVVVDDASIDATPRVIAGLAAAYPDRVRALTLPENSGGCGRPRNTGIEHARGRYVMFLDSDDTLDRHACRNLLTTAEETGADLVSGRCVRVLPEKEENWYPGLYRRSAVYQGVLDCPDLLYDTLSTNKCYRREFLDRERLRFVDRLHYEDLLFSAQAYAAAGVIALIPHRVYNWFVVPGAQTLSITHRRAELRNFADRLEIHRRIDAALRSRGAAALARRKHVKFIEHDLLLYLRELRSRDGDYRRAFLELARAYLAELEDAVFDECDTMPGIGAYMLLCGDLDAAMAAVDFAPKRRVLSIEPVEVDGRIYWSGDHLDTALGRAVLDVTDLGIHSAPPHALRLGGRVTAVRRDGRELRLAGDVVNPLGRTELDREQAADLEIVDRRRPGRVFRVPAAVCQEDGRISWRARFVPARRIRPFGLIDQTWGLRLRLRHGGETITVRLTSDGDAHHGVTVPVRPRLTRIVGDHLQMYVAESGELALRIVGLRWPGRLTLPALRGIARTEAGRRWWRRFLGLERALIRALTSRETKIAVCNRLLVRLPVKKGTVVFESHLGAQYSDNPKYVHRALRESGLPHQAIWSYSRSPRGFPADAQLVKRGSWRYYRALARAEFWVDNQGFPGGLRKRPQTTYIQTWHGSAFKLMGFDEPQIKQSTQAEHQRLHAMVGRYDAFVVRSEHDVRTLAKGLGVTAEPLRTGYPRNDPLVTGGDPGELAELREGLGLRDDRTVVLYAPTFRADENGRPVERFAVPFDLEAFAREFGDSHVLLVRAHYLTTAVVPPGLHGTVLDVGGLHDVTPLMLLSDALITDYSSVMFDYALLDRPIIFYAPDRDDYVTRLRGAYFDLAENAPGPIVAEEAALFAELRDLDAGTRRYAGRRRRFVERFGEYDTGTAAKAIIERYFAGADRA